MKYSRVYIDALGFELPPVVVSSSEIEARLEPLYAKLHLAKGQLEALTGIEERRWWRNAYGLAEGAAAAARKALSKSSVAPAAIGSLIYAGVCREGFEPATACHVAAEIGTAPDALVYDISNACLGVLNGMIETANRIELGQIRAGLVVSCESAREIVEETIGLVLDDPTMETFRDALATFTGGSGAVAVLLTDGSFGSRRRRLLGGVTRTAPEHHNLCRWGWESLTSRSHRQYLYTDAVAVLRHGVELGRRTWESFLKAQEWTLDAVDRVVCHQVGASNREAILSATGIPKEKDFVTFPFLGNMGTVSLPLTAALAEERQFLKKDDKVAFLGIGSGLNCTMLGLEW